MKKYLEDMYSKLDLLLADLQKENDDNIEEEQINRLYDVVEILYIINKNYDKDKLELIELIKQWVNDNNYL